MDVGHCARLLDINGSSRDIYFDNITASCLRRLEFVIAADLAFLRGESVSMDRALPGTSQMLHERQSRNSRTFFQEFFIVQLPKTEVFPPWRFFFAAVKFQDMRQQPSGLFCSGPLRSIIRKLNQ